MRRGQGFLARLIAFFAGMPDAGERVPVELSVVRAEGCERWQRSFGGRPLLTVQWPSEGLLVEALGLVLCLFRLRVVEGALVFDQVRARVGGRRFSLPLPRMLSPRIEGRAHEENGRVQVFVSIGAPIAGFLVSYEGPVDLGVDDREHR